MKHIHIIFQECYDIEYDLSVLDAMLGPSHWDELTKEGKLSHARLVKMQSKIKALKVKIKALSISVLDQITLYVGYKEIKKYVIMYIIHDTSACYK